MDYHDRRASGIKIAYIGGGSRGWAWKLMADLALEEALSGDVWLYDINPEAARQNEVIGNRLLERNIPGKWTYHTAESLEEALQGADFTIISILPGTLDAMETDVHLPEKYGIWQSVGDTAGPGGIVRALRTLPVYRTIAAAIRCFAPDSWVISYTNPMAVCVKTLYHVFPKIKALGCCHEVFGAQNMLMEIYKKYGGTQDIERRDIHVNVLGVNHFTWLDRAQCLGTDLFPLYERFIEENYDTGKVKEEDFWKNEHMKGGHCVKIDLFRRFGLIAAAGDRHLSEFMPGTEYLMDPDTVHNWQFGLTTVASRKKVRQEREERGKRLAAGTEEVDLVPSKEEGVQIIKALCGLGRFVSNVNIPNNGRIIPNLPGDAVVEVNAVLDKDHIYPMLSEGLPENVKELVMPHAKNQSLIVKAALEMDYETALEALMQDPNTKAKITEMQGREMLTAMIQNTMPWLPEGWSKI